MTEFSFLGELSLLQVAIILTTFSLYYLMEMIKWVKKREKRLRSKRRFLVENEFPSQKGPRKTIKATLWF